MLNGTTVQGLAAKVGEEVGAAGFTPGTIGNAARIDQTRSEVLYGPGQQRAARAVANRLGIKSIGPVDSVNREIAGSFDAVVLVGADRGMRAAAEARVRAAARIRGARGRHRRRVLRHHPAEALAAR